MRRIMCLVVLSGILTAGASAPRAATMIYDGVIFGYPVYDYAPSIMVDEGQVKVWWCGVFPGFADVIGFRTAPIGGAWGNGVLALTPTQTPGAWDGLHTCDPSVVRGSFLYGGVNYSYAMYYAGHANSPVVYTQIGVAFSNDGANWVKGPNPIVTPAGPPDPIYGAGVPAFYRFSGTAASGWLVWWDSTWPGGPQNVGAFTTDGVNFGPRQLLHASVQGIIGDVAYSPSEGLWYATTSNPTASGEHLYVYQAADPFSTWMQIGVIDQALTGNSKNHNPAFVKLPNGDLYIGAGGVKYVSFGTGSQDPVTWDLASAHWF